MADIEIGTKFNRWTVLEKVGTKADHYVYWKCQCDCGTVKEVKGRDLRNDRSKSCGCLTKEIASKNSKLKVVDEVGNKYGLLTVIERCGSNERGLALWKCQCDCGNTFIAKGSELRSGHTLSCGCLHQQVLENVWEQNKKDLTNQKFGLLTALYDNGRDSHKNVIWHCQCECGGTKDVPTNVLIRGSVQSCGCLKSKGEQKISQILRDNNIEYETQKSFPTCVFPDTQHHGYFDFYIPNKNYLIEYDGIQHFESKDTGWNTKENLEKTKQRDTFKNNWCKENNIQLIRIPYYVLETLNISDLEINSSTYII